jgi:acylphosphatase
MAIKRAEVIFWGRVQGVGFRFTAEDVARDNNVNGYVRNVPDGTVELVIEGEESTLQKVIDSLNDLMGQVIEKYHVNWFPATGQFQRFEIKI